MTLPSIAPDSESTHAMINMAESIANSAKWQEITGAANATEAKGRIWIAAAEEDDYARPFCSIWIGQLNRMVEGISAERAFVPRGAIGVLFELEIPEAHRESHGDSYFWFLNAIDTIVDEVLAQAGQAGRLAIDSMPMEGPWRAPEGEAAQDEDNDYFQVIFRPEYQS